MGELDSKKEAETMFGLDRIKMPRKADEVHTRISRQMEVEQPRYGKAKVEVVDGFEDLIGGPLGEGFYFNSPGTGYQLSFALAIAPNIALDEALRDASLVHSHDIVKILREKQVLKGLKVVDLGCGPAELVVAMKALGATSYGVDTGDLRSDRLPQIDGYIDVDLNSDQAVQRIVGASNGKFDLVTENILGGVWGSLTSEPHTPPKIFSGTRSNFPFKGLLELLMGNLILLPRIF